MKKLLITSILTLTTITLFAQFKFGIRGGLSTSTEITDNLRIFGDNGQEELSLAVEEARYGIHGGIFFQFEIRNFLIQPEILFNSNSVDFQIDDFRAGGIVDAVRREKYQNLDIPILFGYKAGPVRFHLGPTGHVHINSSSELLDVDGYEQKFEQFTFGYIAGLGLDFWSLMLDFRYEGNFNDFGNHITIDGQQFTFDQSEARFLLSLGILLYK